MKNAITLLILCIPYYCNSNPTPHATHTNELSSGIILAETSVPQQRSATRTTKTSYSSLNPVCLWWEIGQDFQFRVRTAVGLEITTVVRTPRSSVIPKDSQKYRGRLSPPHFGVCILYSTLLWYCCIDSLSLTRCVVSYNRSLAYTCHRLQRRSPTVVVALWRCSPVMNTWYEIITRSLSSV